MDKGLDRRGLFDILADKCKGPWTTDIPRDMMPGIHGFGVNP